MTEFERLIAGEAVAFKIPLVGDELAAFSWYRKLGLLEWSQPPTSAHWKKCAWREEDNSISDFAQGPNPNGRCTYRYIKRNE